MLSVVVAGRTNVDVTLRCRLVAPVGKAEEPVMALRLYADDARGLVSRVNAQLATNDPAGVGRFVARWPIEIAPTVQQTGY